MLSLMHENKIILVIQYLYFKIKYLNFQKWQNSRSLIAGLLLFLYFIIFFLSFRLIYHNLFYNFNF